MRVKREADGSVEVEERPILLRAATILGAVVVPWAVIESATTGTEREPLRVVLGLVAGAFLLALAFLAETRWFRFDRARRMLEWRRSRLTSVRSGRLSFSAISGAIAQPRLDDDNPRTRRLTYRPVLLTTEGEMPLSDTSSLHAEDYAELLAAVRAVVGLPNVEPSDPVLDLVRAGRILDAISLVRQQTGASLEDASQRVRQVQQDLN